MKVEKLTNSSAKESVRSDELMVKRAIFSAGAHDMGYNLIKRAPTIIFAPISFDIISPQCKEVTWHCLTLGY